MGTEQDDEMQGDFDVGIDVKAEPPSPQHALGGKYAGVCASQQAHQGVGVVAATSASSGMGMPMNMGDGVGRSHQTRRGVAGGMPIETSVEGGGGIHSQIGDHNMFGAQQAYDGGAMLVQGEMQRHGGGDVWLGGDGGGGGDGGNVWEILHQMMDDPSGHAAGSSLPRTMVPDHGGGSGQPMSKPAPVFTAGGFDMADGNVEKLTKRLGSLEEEVLNLRQFTMTLIKERGDLAMRIQVTNLHLASCTLHPPSLHPARPAPCALHFEPPALNPADISHLSENRCLELTSHLSEYRCLVLLRCSFTD